MRLSFKAFFIVSSLILIMAGSFLALNVYDIYFNFNPNSTTVLIENGVSGVVTITDPALNKSFDVNVNFYPLGTCSGLIVSSDGYIITAFHVIGNPTSSKIQQLKLMDDNDIKLYLTQIAITDYLKNQNTGLTNEIGANNSTINSTDPFSASSLSQIMAEKNLITVKSYKQVIKVITPSNYFFKGSKIFNARIVDIGNADLYQDIALLRIDNVKDLPALHIGSKGPITGEKIIIYGYRGYKNAQFQGSINPTKSEGTILTGLNNNFGVKYYQTNAKTAKGTSGGPAIDSNNKVVGILIYGVENNFRQSITSDSSIILSSEYIIDVLKRNNVQVKN